MSNREDPGEANHAKLIYQSMCIIISDSREGYKVLVIRYSFLRGTEALI